MGLSLFPVLVVLFHVTFDADATLEKKPHIFLLLADDYGWANAGWHRTDAASDEVKTPIMDALVKNGVELDQAYSYK